MTTELVYELPDDVPEPTVDAVLQVPHFLPGAPLVEVSVRRVDPLLTLRPPAWRVYGLDRAGYGVRVFVHRRHPARAARIEGRAA